VARYSNNVYGGATYGEAPQLQFSVEPMGITVVAFRECYVSWISPKGTFSRIRLVRNQSGFPEEAEDGVIVWEEYATEGTVSRTTLKDGEENLEVVQMVPGLPVYYTMFLFTDAKTWVKAGQITDTVPSDHDAQKRIMDIIPKVFSTKEQSPLAVTDTNSALYAFIEGFSFTYEQLLTFLDLVRPKYSTIGTPFSLIPLENRNVGLTPEPNLPVRNQKRLIREALYMYSHKGTKSGLETYAESLTGFAPTITVSSNLLLTRQDSTFYNGVGNWTATNGTLTASTDLVPDTTVTTNVDTVYTCKIVASAAGSMVVGNTSPITLGVPINSSTEYTMSLKLKSPTSAGSITPTIKFYNKNGTLTSTHSGSAVSANNTWKSASVTATTDATASYAGLTIAWSAAGTYYVDMVCVQAGPTASYTEARSIDVFLSPTKTNYIKNPSFEVNVTDSWTKTGSATVTQDTDVSSISYSGVKSAKIVSTGSWTFTSNTFPISTGTYYTVSGFVKASSSLTVKLIGRNSGGTITDTFETANLGTITNWSKFSVTHLVDALDTTTVTYELQFSGGSGTFYLDCLQAEKGVKATEYFDGSLPSNFGAVWEGTANNSYSHYYTNKPTKVPRLGKTIQDWVPPNTFWRLSTYAGVEYTSLTV
jgi:hypothetical protein